MCVLALGIPVWNFCFVPFYGLNVDGFTYDLLISLHCTQRKGKHYFGLPYLPLLKLAFHPLDRVDKGCPSLSQSISSSSPSVLTVFTYSLVRSLTATWPKSQEDAILRSEKLENYFERSYRKLHPNSFHQTDLFLARCRSDSWEEEGALLHAYTTSVIILNPREVNIRDRNSYTWGLKIPKRQYKHGLDMRCLACQNWLLFIIIPDISCIWLTGTKSIND